MFNDSTEEELKLLIRSTQSEQFRFIAVTYNHYDLVQRTKAILQSEYPERNAKQFSLDNINPEAFNSSIIECKKGIVFLEKFELLFEEKLKTLAVGFNQRRDLFSSFPLQIILFIPEGQEQLNLFQRTLPDIFSITSPFVHLHQELRKSLVAPILTEQHLAFANLNEARDEVIRIENRLKTLENTSENHNLKKSLLILLAEAYRFLGEYNKSKEILSNLLSELESTQENINETEIAHVQNNLALALIDLAEFQEAKVLIQKSIVTKVKNYGENNSTTTTAYSNLALILKALGEFNEAKKMIMKALVSDEKKYGKLHSKTAVHYSNLATILQNLGEFQQAKKMILNAVESDEKNFGKNHLKTAVQYSNLALVMRDLGEFNEAKALLVKSREIIEKGFGKDHTNTAISYLNLAAVLQDLGEIKEAKILLQKSFDILKKTLGENHNTTIKVKNNLDSLSSSTNNSQ